MIAKRYIFILLCMVSNRIFAITDTIPVRLDILTFKINPFLSFDDPDLSPNENYPFEYLKNLIHTNSLGVADSLGVKARIDAVVYSKNFSTQGTLIHIIDKDTVGIIAIHPTSQFNYQPSTGDQITLLGSLHQSMGQLFFKIDTLWKKPNVVSILLKPKTVNTLQEANENSYVRLNGLRLLNPSQWQKGHPSGFCIDATNGKELFKIYIDSKSGLTDANAPFGKFSISGFVYQQDTVQPLFQDYYLVPLSLSDLVLEREYTDASIPQIKLLNSIGEPIELGKFVSVSGWVQSPNYLMKKGGIKCLITDSLGKGIMVLQQKSTLFKTLKKDDFLTVKGKVVQISGNTTILADTMEIGNNSLTSPPLASSIEYISEACEENLSKFEQRFWLTNIEQWKPIAPYFEVRANNSKTELTLRIYEESEWFKLFPPQGSFLLSGYGEQEDDTPPYFQNYFFVVRYKNDIDLSNFTEEIPIENRFAHPNPFTEELIFSIEQQNSPYLTIKNLWGNVVWQRQDNSPVSILPSGTYLLMWTRNNQPCTQKLVKLGN